jgi:tetratricopeptide (TPR) repeat protein
MSETGSSPSSPARALGAAAVVAGAGILVYLTSLDGAFVFDDRVHIVNDEAIRRLRPLGALLAAGTRPVVRLSLAVNHALGGRDPFGYHVFNLAVHLLAAVTLLAVARRTLAAATMPDAVRRNAAGLALAIALLWTVHPLLTQSVTYVIQRAESMMGLAVLLSLYCVIRGAGGTGRGRAAAWYAAAVVVCAVGIGAKAVAAVTPLVVYLYDRAFLAPHAGPPLRRRWPLYLGLVATWLLLIPTGVAPGVLATDRAQAGIGLSVQGVTPLGYFLTQPEVVLHYLRLAVWPRPLVFDYQWPLATGVASVAVPLAIVTGLGLLTAWAIWKRPAWGFLGAWFFLLLAPTSSFIPIKDLAAEQRMYLPLAAVVALVVLVAHRVIARLAGGEASARMAAMIAVMLAATTLGSLTIQRNRDYHEPLALWLDTAAKRPDNARAHLNACVLLRRAGREDEAVAAAERAVAADPDYAKAWFNLGQLQQSRGRRNEATVAFGRAVEADPNLAPAQISYGMILAAGGRFVDAIEPLEAGLARRPRHVQGQLTLAAALAAQNRAADALARYRLAAETDPDNTNAWFGQGWSLMRLERHAEALVAFQRTLEIDPDHVRARRAMHELEDMGVSGAPALPPPTDPPDG